MQDNFNFTLNVSRETLERLRAYEGLVRTWTQRINLIAPSTVDEMWQRHICDSAQILTDIKPIERWLDIGSGGGFPGVVVAIVLSELQPNAHVILIESDVRKCVFLKTVARQLNLSFDVITSRIERVAPQDADIVSARALAPLTDLLGFATRHMRPNGTGIFMKGAKWSEELKEAKLKWSFDVDMVQSTTDSDAAVLKIKNIKRN